jgi:hypothetical protein
LDAVEAGLDEVVELLLVRSDLQLDLKNKVFIIYLFLNSCPLALAPPWVVTQFYMFE